MTTPELDPLLASLRVEELRGEAASERLAIRLRGRRRLFGLRRPRLTIEIHLSPGLRPDQIDRVFTSLSRHLS
jgi:hypothetical protein